MARLLELQKFAFGVATLSWDRYQRVFFPHLSTLRPEIVISKRMKTTAGNCNVWDRKITLCYDLLDLYPSEFGADTIPHELGHQVAYDIFGIGRKEGPSRVDWHGNDWKRVMISAGYSIERCHDMVNTRHKK
jgi:predicted SprT family Zn-dependent metalloprotease